jgi:hypothetical protein
MHLGTLFVLVTYFTLCNGAGWSAEGVRAALLTSLLIQTTYVAIAWAIGELKHFDHAIWIFFALGTIAAYAGIEPLFGLYWRYSPALAFIALGLAAALPPLLGREPFTYFFARRQTPRWQQKTPTFASINRVITAWWALVFFLAAALCLWAPRDPMFTIVWPNLLVVAGLSANFWMPRLYLWLFPAPFPEQVEALIMGMPFVFDRKRAGDSRAVIQFRVSGSEPGDYYLRIERGRCLSFEGVAPAADLTVITPDTVWRRIVRGDLDGGAALGEGLYRVEGDLPLLLRMQEWFPSQRPTT